jgi:hypothetical protein
MGWHSFELMGATVDEGGMALDLIRSDYERDSLELPGVQDALPQGDLHGERLA